MELKLNKKVSNVTIIEGFPGFGFVGTVATEFLINHLKGEMIGKFWFEDLPPSVTIHEGRMIKPVEIYYAKNFNTVIVHSISFPNGIEWAAADIVNEIAKKTSAKEIISIEGVGTVSRPANKGDAKVFYYTGDKKKGEKFKKIGVEPLKEGIIMGVTSAIMLKAEKPMTCVFAETFSQLPDSKAAAKVIEVLDKYLGLKVDYKPLLKEAEKFEEKVKSLIEKSQSAAQQLEKKQLSYLG